MSDRIATIEPYTESLVLLCWAREDGSRVRMPVTYDEARQAADTIGLRIVTAPAEARA